MMENTIERPKPIRMIEQSDYVEILQRGLTKDDHSRNIEDHDGSE